MIKSPTKIYRRLYSTPGTSGDVPATPLSFRLKGYGVIDLTSDSAAPPCMLSLIPFGTGMEGDEFTMIVHGWKIIEPLSPIWVPFRLLTCTFELSGVAGISGCSVTNTERFASVSAFDPDLQPKTINLDGSSFEYKENSITVFDSEIASVEVPTRGFNLVSVRFFDVSSGAFANAAYLPLE